MKPKCLVFLALPILLFTSCSKEKTESKALVQELDLGRMSKAPVLDGNLVDWQDPQASILLGQAADTLPRPGKWEGTPDLSGIIHLAWDDQFLYLAAEVADDKLLQSPDSGAEPWQGDTIELFFNTRPGEQRTPCFRQLALVPPLEAGKKLAVLCPQGDFLNVEGNAVTGEKGYTLECRIPWANLPGFKPAEGTSLGFQVMLDDRDSKGRKSQLCWYPSAITFNQPTHMNVLKLAAKASTTQPGLLAGITAACATDPNKMPFSVLANVEGAEKAVVQMKGDENNLSFPLIKTGKRAAVGQGIYELEGEDGLKDFSLELQDKSGKTLLTKTVAVELAGQRYTAMKKQLKEAQARLSGLSLETAKGLEQLKNNDGKTPQEKSLAGLGFWIQRVNASAFNEARPESVTAPMLDQMLLELGEINKAMDRFAKQEDPYLEQKGSLVRAYKSPLTGEFRPHALYVPKDYKPGKPRALIVVLHGIFGDERHLFEMVNQIKDLDAIVYQAAAYRQFDWSDISASESWAGLDEVLKDYSIDPDRITLMGHHIGGRGVLQLAMDRPGFFAGAASLYPGIDVHLPYNAMRLYPQFYEKAVDNAIPFPHFKKPAAAEPLTDSLEKQWMESLSLATRAENIAQLPLLMTDGEADPDAAAERLALLERLDALGNKVSLRYVPGAMHGGHPPELEDPAFYQWLLKQKKSKTPDHFVFVVPTLAANTAWHVKVEALESPLKPGRIEVTRKDVENIEIKTSGVKAFAPLFYSADLGQNDYVAITIDGQVFPMVFPGDWKDDVVVKNESGVWEHGQSVEFLKHKGMSGPIDDFQSGRFLYVYGTGGTPEENTLLEKMGRKFSNRGLGTEFGLKADKDLSENEMFNQNLVLLGSPKTNLVLARMEQNLPLKWEPAGFSIGTEKVEGPGAGACFIYPSPLPGHSNIPSTRHYVVVLSAVDEAGYRVWDQRAGVDYVLGKSGGDKSAFVNSLRGVFDSKWIWDKTLSFAP